MADMLEAQSQDFVMMSFDDDHELFRQDTDVESEGEDQVEVEEGEEEEEELLIDLVHVDGAVSIPSSSKQKEKEKEKEKPEVPAPEPEPKGKETILITDRTPPKKQPLTLVELPVDVLKEIVKEVGLLHLLSAPPSPQLRVRQL